MDNDAYRLPSFVGIKKYHIRASYTTLKGNSKQRTFEVYSASDDDVVFWFHRSIESHNETRPNSKMLNVEILSVDAVGKSILKINSVKDISITSL